MACSGQPCPQQEADAEVCIPGDKDHWEAVAYHTVHCAYLMMGSKIQL